MLSGVEVRRERNLVVIVVMHLLALGAFWPAVHDDPVQPGWVVMHLLALGAFWLGSKQELQCMPNRRNAPSGARFFLAFRESAIVAYALLVVMHLLALGAFWRNGRLRVRVPLCRNAPSGTRCFLARMECRFSDRSPAVVMHLRALGAFWPSSKDLIAAANES